MSDTGVVDMSKAEPTRRLEIFTVAGRRRSWTAEQKAQIVAESYGVGVTLSAVARRHALTVPQLCSWRRKAALSWENRAAGDAMAFARVMVTPSPHSGSLLPPMIEVVVGTMRVRVPTGADAVTLQTVLRAVQAVS